MSTKLHDLQSAGLFAQFITQNVTAVTSSSVATTGATVDMIRGDGPCLLYIRAGTKAGTTTTCAVSMQESTDGTTWTGIVGCSTQTVSSDQTKLVQFERAARYLQSIQVTAGTSAVIPLHVSVIQQVKAATA